MLKNLQKYFNREGAMTIENTVITSELSEMQASFAQVTEALAAAQEEIKEKTAALEVAQAALTAIENEKAEALAAAHKAQMDARLTKLQNIVGDAKAAELSVAFEKLDDGVFEAMVGTLSANMATESQSEQFVEKGVDAEVTTPAETDMVTRLAAKLKAEYAPAKDAK